MCGIFGAVQTAPKSGNESTQFSVLRGLAGLSGIRGKEGSGISFIDPRDSGHPQVYKKPLRMDRLLRWVLRNPRMAHRMGSSPIVMGHSRLVTHGSSEDIEVIQPISGEEIVGTHNGIILNFEEIGAGFEGAVSDLRSDSHTLFCTLNRVVERDDSNSGDVERLLGEIKGTASCAIYLTKTKELVLFSNHGSLWFLRHLDGGTLYWASEKRFLERVAKRLSGKFEIRQAGPKQFFWLSWDPNAGTFRERISTQEISAQLRALNPMGGSASVLVARYKDISEAFERARAVVDRIPRCRKCVLPNTIPHIEFDDEGVCQFCRLYISRPVMGAEKLHRKIEAARRSGSSLKTLLAFSGGRDSSYALHGLVKDFGIKPTTYTYEWGMVTDIARRNIARMCGELGVEHIIVSADIRQKRENVRKNVLAWLKRPHLGMIPLFMAGDKPFFWHIHKLSQELRIDINFFSLNHLENAQFKEDFAGGQYWDPRKLGALTGPELPLLAKLRLPLFYGREFLRNPRYLNSSLADTFWGYLCYYFFSKDYLDYYQFVEWNEGRVDQTLAQQYGWESILGTTTWRIGDGTTPFYNFIYYMMAGFTEHDTLRSNQVREGHLTRQEALALTRRDNIPNWEILEWYFQVIGLDMTEVLNKIVNFPRAYESHGGHQILVGAPRPLFTI